MLEARERSEWSRMSSLMAFLAQTVTGLAGKPKRFSPSDFDPFTQTQKNTHRMGAAEFGQLLGIKRQKPEGTPNENRNGLDHPDPAGAGGPDGRVPG